MMERADPARGAVLPVTSVRRFRVLFGQSRFWVIQVLVGIVTAFHGVVEFFGEDHFGGFLGGISYLPVALYVLPIVLAAYWYGLEGALMTGVLATVLSIPNLLLFHRSEFAWLGEMFGNTTVLALGLIVGLMVERARVARGAAEATSMRLRALQRVTEVLNRHETPVEMTRAVLEALIEAPQIDGASFVASREVVGGTDGLARLAVHTLEITAGEVPEASETAAATVEIRGTPIGELVAYRPEGHRDDRDRELVEHVAGELALAVEHALIREGTRLGLKSYARAVTVAQEAERRRIARDLHDGPAQSLVVLSRGLRRIAERAVEGTDDEAAATKELTALAQTTLQSIRETIGALRPSLLDDLGLVAALGSLVEKESPNRVTVEFRVMGEPRRLDDHVEVAAYRIAQEALANAANHAECSRVEARLEFTPEDVALTISDDGSGFDESAVRPGSFGLVGMRERAELVGGNLRIRSVAGVGTMIRFTVPARQVGGFQPR